MTTVMHEDRQQHLIACRAAVDHARQGKLPQQLSLALIDLGAALFKTRVFDQGVEALDEAEKLAASLDDLSFLAHCLGLKAAVYQEAGRFHNAFEIIERIVDLAQAQADQGMECDALITQGQILANSGDPIAALNIVEAARALANEISDKRHLMKVFGVLGDIETSRAAFESAQTYFEMATAWANNLGESRPECGYLLNLGTVFVWQGLFSQALQVFERVLIVARDSGEQDAELTALQHTIQCLHKLKMPDRIVSLAHQGIALSQGLARYESAFLFFESAALTYHQLGEHAEALDVLHNAIEYAQTIGDRNYEANMLLHLGESYLAMEQYDQALEPLEAVSSVLQELEREVDKAHVVGRIGVALAESGRIDEAIPYHLHAVDLSRQHKIRALEAEQLTMLALAYHEQNNRKRAQECSQEAAEIFSSIGLETEASRAHQLLAEVSA